MYRLFEVLRWIGVVFGTASAVQTVNKYSLYGHLLLKKEKHLTKSFSSDWPIIAKASSLPVYQVVSEHISDHTVIFE